MPNVHRTPKPITNPGTIREIISDMRGKARRIHYACDGDVDFLAETQAAMEKIIAELNRIAPHWDRNAW